MRSQKWYLLDPLLGALRDTHGLPSLYSRLYKGSHKILKNVYCKRSKLGKLETDETVSHHSQSLATLQISERRTVTQQRTNACKMFSVKTVAQSW